MVDSKKIALVCIAKNEDDYLHEWIDYHKKLGFDDIFIIQNDWRWNSDSPHAHKLILDGVGMQQPAYNAFANTYRNEYDWAAFYDVDEFLVLNKHKNVHEFVNDYSTKANAIGVNVMLFGNNGLTKKTEDLSQIRRFTKRQSTVNKHVKCLVSLKVDFHMFTHNPNIPWTDTEYSLHTGPFNEHGSIEIAQLNHYFCRTQEEFQTKIHRGLADNPSLFRTMEEFEPHNFNEIEDLYAYQFMYGEQS